MQIFLTGANGWIGYDAPVASSLAEERTFAASARVEVRHQPVTPKRTFSPAAATSADLEER